MPITYPPGPDENIPPFRGSRYFPSLLGFLAIVALWGLIIANQPVREQIKGNELLVPAERKVPDAPTNNSSDTEDRAWGPDQDV